MNKETFLLYFKKKENIVNHENDNEVKITNVIKRSTSYIMNAELTLVVKERQKSGNQEAKYQKTVSETIKIEVGMYAKVCGTASAIKKFSSKYGKCNFNRTSWKAKCRVANPTFKKAGRPNLLMKLSSKR